jgi:preprotein translocase subunit SecG
MQNRIADRKRRLNRYVVVVALLWLVTSFALLFFSNSGQAHAAKPQQPDPNTLIQPQEARSSPPLTLSDLLPLRAPCGL